MFRDPAEEVRDRRRTLLQERYGGLVSKLLAEAAKWQLEHPGRSVDLRSERRVRRAS